MAAPYPDEKPTQPLASVLDCPSMTRRSTPWPAGVPCWLDLNTPDVRRAGAFYAAVCGWDGAEPDEDYGGYVIATVDGLPVAGIGPQTTPGQPGAWIPYLATDDADAVAAAVPGAGGTVLLAPGDVGPLGRLGLFADPTGAVFGAWQAGEHLGAQLVNEPGGLVWEDLRSTDPAAATAFYAQVFGYEIRPLAEAGPGYGLFHLPGDDAPLGGMGGLFGEAGPSRWLLYIAVADDDAALEAVAAGGGTVVWPANDTPYGRMATINDPFGAELALMQPAPDQPQPER
jgi:predicted enzyme related to lactoylglutathione lyase